MKQGDRFGRLVVKEISTIKNKQGKMWKCECDCGEVVLCRSDNLKNGNTTSCGCKNIEWAKYLLDMVEGQPDSYNKNRTINFAQAKLTLASNQRRKS